MVLPPVGSWRASTQYGGAVEARLALNSEPDGQCVGYGEYLSALSTPLPYLRCCLCICICCIVKMAWMHSRVLSSMLPVVKHAGKLAWKCLKTALVPPRCSPRLVKWVLLRSLLLALFVSPYIIPILGDIYLPPRRLQPPKTPYGLSLVDTLPSHQAPAVE